VNQTPGQWVDMVVARNLLIEPSRYKEASGLVIRPIRSVRVARHVKLSMRQLKPNERRLFGLFTKISLALTRFAGHDQKNSLLSGFEASSRRLSHIA
jgi:hypothetical protein